MRAHRLFVFSSALALLTVGVYACSDDAESGGSADAGADTSATPDAGGTDAAADVDVEPLDADTSDGAPPPDCVGNPLAADGGLVGATLDAGAKAILTGAFLYGPVWADDLDGGNIFYSEVYNQRVMKADLDGGNAVIVNQTVAATVLPLQNATKNGFLYTTLSVDPGPGASIQRLRIDGGGPTVTFPLEGGVVSPSGIAVSKKGISYITDPAYQVNTGATTGIYRLPEDGGVVSTVTTFTGGEKPFGLAFNLDESALYVSFVEPPQIRRYPLNVNGIPGAPTTLAITLAGKPFGLAIDSGGNLWVAEAASNDSTNGVVEVFDPTGATRWATIPFPLVRPTGIAFGGPDKKTVFVSTERGDPAAPLFTLRTRCGGRP